MDEFSKENIENLIEDYSNITMKLSLKYFKDLRNNVADKDDLKHLNEMKKHLNFAKKTYKELYEPKKGKDIPTDNSKELQDKLSKIKELASAVGNIVTDMRQDG